MMLIDTNKKSKWDDIEKNHSDGFLEYWKDKKIQDKINNLIKEDREFISLLFKNDKSKYLEEISEVEVKKYITEKNIHKFKEYRNKYKDLFFYDVDKEKDIKNLIIQKREEVRKEPKKYKSITENIVNEIEKITKNLDKEFYDVLKKDLIEEKPSFGNLKKIKFIKSTLEEFFEKNFSYDKLPLDYSESKIKDKNKEWNRHKIISAMNVPVCPYCGRQYTTNYSNNEKTTADLDHYYPKSKYPYLALSLYNFVPSCLYCNRIKNNKENHLYPYEEEFGDNAIFRTSIDSINGILESKADKFNVEIKIIDLKESESNGYKERLEKSIKNVFKLEEVYKTSHNQYIIDMLHTIEHYPDTYLDTIAEIFEDTKEKDKELKELKEKNEHEKDEKIECQIKQTIKEIDDINTNKTKLKIQLQEILRKPYFDRIERKDTLSKLTKDILTEYGFYK